MKSKSIKLGVIGSVLLGVCTTSALAQVVNNEAYLTDTRSIVARSGHGLCWRTAEWTPAMAIAECDPDLVKKPEPAPAPAPVAVAPMPAPKPVPLPPPPPPKCDFTATLAADATFAFGKSVLTAGAKRQLDAVAAKAAACASVSSVTVIGHTDRIGSEAANQRLSEQRAAAVKSYLQGKGVNAVTFDAKGAGESQPLENVNCSDKLSRAKLAACLAPNRRVVIDLEGTGK
ncbi:MAG: OmpA family protein [Gammaproteobacteria bacterium]|nr:OmpA family protein [Gammaproteobacteria bacterium]MBU1416539.1 OmpA family protein [Gammaproteobacteria bacterium]